MVLLSDKHPIDLTIGQELPPTFHYAWVILKRADIWAFGVVLYETLTGRRAFVADDASDTLALVLKFEPDWDAIPAETPARIRRVIQTCLDKRPTQRIQAIGDVRLAMEGTFQTTVSPSSQTAADPHPFRFWQRPAVAIISLLLVAAVTGLLVWTLRQDASREVTRFTYDLPVGHQLRVFTRGMVAASPDGRQFVYNTEEGLYLRSMDTLEARLLPGTEDTLGVPFFSPDGQSVGYLQGGQVKRLALSGGAPVNVSETEQALSASWASENTIWLSVREGILRVSANGGIPEVVIPVSADEVFETPQLLPDGDTVLFTLTSTSGGGGDIRWDDARVVAQRLASGERTVLVEGGRDARYVPTGHLVYALGDGLFAVAFDVDNLTVTSGPVSMVEGVVRAETAAAANFAVSDDGTLFYLSGGRQTTSPLVWVDRTGRVDEIQTVPPNEYGTPRLSPGEDRVLVVAEGDLRVYDLTSGRESRITTDGATLYYADWTPSGAEIAYSSSRGSEGPNVWMQPSDGSGEARQLTALDGRVHFDAWAPDGRTFTAHRHDSDSNNQLIVSLDGTDAQVSVWLDREFSDTNAVFSPDGRYVAFVSEQTGQREIYVQPFPGPGGQTPVSVGGGSEPVWAANGEVFYRRPSDYTMMAVDVSTDPELVVGPPTELFTGGSVPPGGGGPRPRYSVTKDGQRFLMSAAALPSDEAGIGAAVSRVNIVLNWTQELLERVPVP